MKLRTLIGYAVIAIAIIVAYEAIVTDARKHVPQAIGVAPWPSKLIQGDEPPEVENTIRGYCEGGSLLMVRPPKGSKAAPHWACNDFRRADLPQR